MSEEWSRCELSETLISLYDIIEQSHVITILFTFGHLELELVYIP